MNGSPIIGQIPALGSLLQHAGAKPARFGRRWDCPTCGKPGHVSVDFGKGVFHCWHAGCDFRGSTFTLARSLGFASPTPEQAQAYTQELHRAQEAAAYEHASRKARRAKLYDAHQSLLSIRYGAGRRLRQFPEDETAWSALAFAYRQSPLVRAELLILEDASFADRRRFMRETESIRQAAINRVIERGGLTDLNGKFQELGYA